MSQFECVTCMEGREHDGKNGEKVYDYEAKVTVAWLLHMAEMLEDCDDPLQRVTIGIIRIPARFIADCPGRGNSLCRGGGNQKTIGDYGMRNPVPNLGTARTKKDKLKMAESTMPVWTTQPYCKADR